MRYRFVLLVSLLATAFAERAQSQPVISGVSGTVAHGQNVNLTGSGFGLKPIAAPIKYDDFQTLTNGQTLDGSGWTIGGLYKPVASTATLRPGTPFARNARAHFNGRMPFSQEADASNFYLTGKTFVKGYLDFWMYADSRNIGSAKPQNIKIFRLHQTSAGDPNAYFSTTVEPGSGGDSLCAARDGTATTEWPGCAPSTVANNGGIPNNEFPGTEFWDKWHHFQVVTAAGTNTNSNGTWILYIDGKLRYNRPGNIQMMRANFSSWKEIYFGNYVRSEEWDGDAYFNWESVYVDNTWARVELCDTASYTTRQHCEIQNPSAWSASSVSARINAGSFPSGSTAYLFVVDANNVPSAGRAVTVGSGGPPQNCTTTTTTLAFPVGGGTLPVPVTGPAGCSWTSASDQTWVAPSSASATGPGQVSFIAQANTSTSARTATLTVAGVSIAASQPGQPPPSCTYTVTPTSATAIANGSTAALDLVASAPTCPWSVTSNQTWLTATPTSGTGSGPVTWTAAANPSSAVRSAVVTIGPLSVSLTQEGTPSTGTSTWCFKATAVGGALTIVEIPCSP